MAVTWGPQIEPRVASLDRIYIKAQMPVQVTFNLFSPSDQWLRAQIAGTASEALQLQAVIVAGMDEADRIMADLARLKYQRGLPYGGARVQRAHR